jgi:L-ascorbate metabolism protein UlaG (beta-lactamase superfamily)
MELIWYGHACFKIKDRNITIVTDPYSNEIGLAMPKLDADILTVSHRHFDHDNVSAVSARYVLTTPGEFEIKGIFIEGIDSFHDTSQGAERGRNTIFVFHLSDLTVCHLGDLGHTLTDEEAERIGDVDILLIPVGGKFTIDAKEAVSVINQIEPKVVVPMHYKTEGINIDLDEVKKFCEEMGVSEEPQGDTLKIQKKDLPEEGMNVVILTPSK